MSDRPDVVPQEPGLSATLVFNHIPKCAGTSLRTALEAALEPDRMVYRVDRSLVGGYTDFDALDEVAASEFVHRPEDLPDDADLVTGHLAPGTTRVRYPGARQITVLRHPGLRLLSQWVHARALSDFDLRHFGERGGPAFRAARGSLHDYLEHAAIAPNVDNTITRFLVWPHERLSPTGLIDERDDEELLDAALLSLAAFDHVGLVEDPRFLDRLSEALGVRLPDTRLNERISVPRSRRPDFGAELDPATTELLARRTRLDRRLWVEVARTALPDSDPDAVLAAAWAKAMARYDAALLAPHETRAVRRTAELGYAVWAAARGRRRPWW